MQNKSLQQKTPIIDYLQHKSILTNKIYVLALKTSSSTAVLNSWSGGCQQICLCKCLLLTCGQLLTRLTASQPYHLNQNFINSGNHLPRLPALSRFVLPMYSLLYTFTNDRLRYNLWEMCSWNSPSLTWTALSKLWRFV